MRTFTKQNYLRKYNGLWNIGIGLSERRNNKTPLILIPSITSTRWHLAGNIVVSPQLSLKKEGEGREEPEILGCSPFSETFSTLKTQTPRRRHLELPKRCWLKTYVRFLISLNKSIELNKIHHYFMCTSFAGRMNY